MNDQVLLKYHVFMPNIGLSMCDCQGRFLGDCIQCIWLYFYPTHCVSILNLLFHR